MATLYRAYDATVSFDGMQSADVCDEAFDAAKEISEEDPDTEFVLEDSDGVFALLGGRVKRLADAGEEWDGVTGFTH